MKAPPPFVSVLMLTHNAPDYVELSVRSVAQLTIGVECELIVLDNASEEPTRALVRELHSNGLIHKIRMMDRNTLFAEGNNLASQLADPRATHYLLLNSDIEARDPIWLKRLLEFHQRGITAYGVAQDPDRVDGYCLLIDRDLYDKHRLDEGHQWWWGVTKLQAKILNEGYPVRGFAEHAHFLTHFGGKSGSGFKHARGMDVTREEVREWFDGKSPEFIDRLPDGGLPGERQVARKAGLLQRALGKASLRMKLSAFRD